MREDASAERSAWARGRLGLPNLNLAEPFGYLRKPPVEADEGCVAFGCRRMESVREVHPFRHPAQSYSGGGRGLKFDPREPRESAKGASDRSTLLDLGGFVSGAS